MLKSTFFHITIITILLAAGGQAVHIHKQGPELQTSTVQVIAVSSEMEATWHPDAAEYDCDSDNGVSICNRW
jgi:hypothetical protein